MLIYPEASFDKFNNLTHYLEEIRIYYKSVHYLNIIFHT